MINYNELYQLAYACVIKQLCTNNCVTCANNISLYMDNTLENMRACILIKQQARIDYAELQKINKDIVLRTRNNRVSTLLGPCLVIAGIITLIMLSGVWRA